MRTPEQPTEPSMTNPLLFPYPNISFALGGRGLVRSAVAAEVLDLTGESSPNVLLVSSAASSQAGYDQFVGNATEHFVTGLGARVTHLHETYEHRPGPQEVADKVGEAHIIWASFGRGQKANGIWLENGFIELTRAAAEQRRIIWGGGSAAMLAALKSGMSYSTPPGGPNEFVPIDGHGFVGVSGSPHLNLVEDDQTQPRSHFFEAMLRRGDFTVPAIGIDEEAWLVMHEDSFRVVNAVNDGSVHVYSKPNGVLSVVDFEPHPTYAPISRLL